MDRDAKNREEVDVDRLSNLPESLLCQILLNLLTRDVVKTSVLSKRWKNLWKDVPALYLYYGDFEDHEALVSFADRFLGFNSESCLQIFELRYYNWAWDDSDLAHIIKWIDTVIKRKVQYLHFLENPWSLSKRDEMEIPQTVYTCESLVSLNLYNVLMPNPKSVSLLSLKVIELDMVDFANDWAFERLVSSCPVLERLTVITIILDYEKELRVCSHSLLSFELNTTANDDDEYGNEELVVVIDAPRLEKLKIVDCKTDCIIIKNVGSLAKVEIDVMFNMYELDPNDIPKRNMIRNFLIGISSAREMFVTSFTLKAIYDYSRWEPLPIFRNLSSLSAVFKDYRWETLPIFLESCPNLKSLSLSLGYIHPQEEPILPEPHRLLPSLESVEILRGMKRVDADVYMKLASYLLRNSTVLKEFTLCLDKSRKNEESVILKNLLAIPKVSSSCQVSVL